MAGSSVAPGSSGTPLWRPGFSSTAPSRAAPSQPGSSACAVAALTRISRELAASSSRSVPVAAGPAITSSRCERPERKKWHGPEWMPTAIVSSTAPTELRVRPVSSISHCISPAAMQARRA